MYFIFACLYNKRICTATLSQYYLEQVVSLLLELSNTEHRKRLSVIFAQIP